MKLFAVCLILAISAVPCLAATSGINLGCNNVTAVPSINITSVLNDNASACGAASTGSCVRVNWTSDGLKGVNATLKLNLTITNFPQPQENHAATVSLSAGSHVFKIAAAPLQSSYSLKTEVTYNGCVQKQKDGTFIIP